MSEFLIDGPVAIRLGNFVSVDFHQDFTINGEVSANSSLATAFESGGRIVTLNGTCTGSCSGF